MNTKRRLCLALVSLMLCVVLIFGVAACDDTPEEDIPSAETDSDLLFTNGTFGNTTGSTYPLTPSNWTGARGSSSGSNSTPGGSDNLIAGVISVEPDSYSDNRDTYGNVGSPGKPEGAKDDNILMIYNKVPTVYKYTSASVSLATSSYYKLTFSVYTDIEDGDAARGAYVYVNGGAYAAFKAIDTDNKWVTYTVYIETSDISSQNITVVLSLGDGNKIGGAMTQGYAYFDEVKLENLSDVEEGETAFTEADFDAVTVNDTTAKYTMKVSDGEFDYSTTTTSPYSASKWSGMAGRGDGDNAPSSSSYVSKGIVDSSVTSTVAAHDGSDVDVTVAEGTVGTKMLMINNKQATAYGYRSSAAMRLFGGNDSYYKISVKVRTAALAEGGASIALTDGSNDSDPYLLVTDINTNGAWQTIDLFVQANQFRSTDIYLELWLGRGGEDNADTHVEGVAFFDGVTLDKATAEQYNSPAAEGRTHSFLTDEANLDRASLTTADFVLADADAVIPDRTTWKNVNTSDWAANGATLFPELDNPSVPVTSWDNKDVLVIHNYKSSSFALSTLTEGTDSTEASGLFTVSRNRCYIISVWVKTQDIKEGSGITVALFSYDKDAKEEDERKTQLSSFTNVNTADLDDYVSEGNNGYTELRFVVKGANAEDTLVGLDVSFGSGTSMQPTTHLSGYAMLSSISIESIDYDDYSSVSTDTVTKSVSLLSNGSSTELSSNGYFNYIDVSATQSAYADIATDADPVYTDDGILGGFAGVPDGWTVNNSANLTAEGTVAGVLELDNPGHLGSDRITDAFGAIDADTFYDGMDLVGANKDNYPNVLAIHSAANISYESDSVSLSASSYYLLGVWVKTDGKSTVTVSVDASTDSAAVTTFTPADDAWHYYSFYIRTGFTAVDVTMTLGVAPLGGNVNTAYFAIASYNTVPEATFEKAQTEDTASDNITVKSFTVDSFDSATDLAEMDAPDNWSGATLDEDASTSEEDFAGGVFNQREGNWDELGIDPDVETAIAGKLDASTAVGNGVLGDNVLVINNKVAGAYSYSADSITLEGDTYYKVSIWALTYKLDRDETATISLKLNNLTYTFGRQNHSEGDDAKRVINTSTYAEDGTETVGDWTQYTFYVHTEKDVTPTAVLTAQLGFDGHMVEGYAFFDNFEVDKISEDDYKAATNTDESTGTVMDVANNYAINFTEEDANAEEEPDEDDETEDPGTSDLIWLWITSAVIGVILLVVVIVVLVRKYTASRKFKSRKKPTSPTGRTGDRRDENNNKGDRR